MMGLLHTQMFWATLTPHAGQRHLHSTQSMPARCAASYNAFSCSQSNKVQPLILLLYGCNAAAFKTAVGLCSGHMVLVLTLTLCRSLSCDKSHVINPLRQRSAVHLCRSTSRCRAGEASAVDLVSAADLHVCSTCLTAACATWWAVLLALAGRL